MPPQVNLLPWRRQLRQARLRFWACMALGSLGLTAVPGGFLWLEWQLLLRQFLAEQQAHQQRMSGAAALVSQRQAQQAARQEVIRQGQQRLLRQEAARRTGLHWQARLNRLAEIMPDSAWLTLLTAREASLMFSGLSQTLEGIALFEQTLPQAGGARHQTGAIMRAPDGNWQFSYRVYYPPEAIPPQEDGNVPPG